MNEFNESLKTRIDQLCKERNISRYKALKESGVGRTFVANLIKTQTASTEKVTQLANYFNVSVDYLLTGENKNKPDAVDGIELTENEIEHLKWYRSANDTYRKIATEILKHQE